MKRSTNILLATGVAAAGLGGYGAVEQVRSNGHNHAMTQPYEPSEPKSSQPHYVPTPSEAVAPTPSAPSETARFTPDQINHFEVTINGLARTVTTRAQQSHNAYHPDAHTLGFDVATKHQEAIMQVTRTTESDTTPKSLQHLKLMMHGGAVLDFARRPNPKPGELPWNISRLDETTSDGAGIENGAIVSKTWNPEAQRFDNDPIVPPTLDGLTYQQSYNREANDVGEQILTQAQQIVDVTEGGAAPHLKPIIPDSQ